MVVDVNVLSNSMPNKTYKVRTINTLVYKVALSNFTYEPQMHPNVKPHLGLKLCI